MPKAIIGCVTDVQPHPNSDNLDIVSIGGHTNVANRPAPNQPRYAVGDYAIILVDNLILPDWLLMDIDMWNHEKNKGGLAGSKGNRTKGRNIAGVMSDVALYKIEWTHETRTAFWTRETLTQFHDDKFVVECFIILLQHFPIFYSRVRAKGDGQTVGPEGIDVTDMLGVSVYEPAQ